MTGLQDGQEQRSYGPTWCRWERGGKLYLWQQWQSQGRSQQAANGSVVEHENIDFKCSGLYRAEEIHFPDISLVIFNNALQEKMENWLQSVEQVKWWWKNRAILGRPTSSSGNHGSSPKVTGMLCGLCPLNHYCSAAQLSLGRTHLCIWSSIMAYDGQMVSQVQALPGCYVGVA